MSWAWHDTETNYNELIRVARRLIEKGSAENIRLISIGQSPAWIAQAVKLSDSHIEVKKIAFSGHFMTGQATVSTKTFYLDNKYTGEKDLSGRPLGEKRYRQYLAQKQMSPQQIVEKFEKEGTITLFSEYVGSGRGLASFLSVLYLWAQEEKCVEKLNNAIKICMLHNQTNRQFDRIKLSGFEHIDIPVEYEPIDERLTVSRDTGANSDRLVPHYDHTKWMNPPKKISNKIYLDAISEQVKNKFSDANLFSARDKEHKKSILLIRRLENYLAHLPTKSSFRSPSPHDIRDAVESILANLRSEKPKHQPVMSTKHIAILKSGYLKQIFNQLKFNIDTMDFTDSASERIAFIRELKNYYNDRQSTAKGEHTSFWSQFFKAEMNRTNKLEAVSNMIAHLNADGVLPTFEPKHINALRDGSLGYIIKKYERYLPEGFKDAEAQIRENSNRPK